MGRGRRFGSIERVARTAALQDPRPRPTQSQFVQLGHALMAEALDAALGVGLEHHAVHASVSHAASDVVARLSVMACFPRHR